MSPNILFVLTDNQRHDLLACAGHPVLRTPHPAYAHRGEGCRLIDLEGVSRIDFSNNMASLIHGHAHAPIVEALHAQIDRGTAFMMATEAEVLHAEHIGSSPACTQEATFVKSTEHVLKLVSGRMGGAGRRVRCNATLKSPI